MTQNRYWEDFRPGDTFQSSGRQMTDADTRLLIGVISGSHPLHTDPIYCASRPDVLRPILQGSLVLGVMDAFFFECVCPGNEVLALVDGYEKIRFIKPIYIGDVLRAEFEVMERRDGRTYGSLTCGVTVRNQDGDTVVFAMEHYLVEKKGERGDRHGSNPVF